MRGHGKFLGKAQGRVIFLFDQLSGFVMEDKASMRLGGRVRRERFKGQDVETLWLTQPVLLWTTPGSRQDAGVSGMRPVQCTGEGCGIFQELVNTSSLCKERQLLMLPGI